MTAPARCHERDDLAAQLDAALAACGLLVCAALAFTLGLLAALWALAWVMGW